jgi:hypothetical protein
MERILDSHFFAREGLRENGRFSEVGQIGIKEAL